MIGPVRAMPPSPPLPAPPRAEAVGADSVGQARPEVPRLADLARRLKAGERASAEPFQAAFRSPDPVQRRAADLLLYDLSYEAVPMESRPALRQEPAERLYERLHLVLAACAESDWPLKPEDMGATLRELETWPGPVPPQVLQATVHAAHELQKRSETPRATTGFRLRELEAPELDATWAKALAGQARRWADDGRLQTSLRLDAEALAQRLVVDGAAVTAPSKPASHPPEIAALAAEIAKDLNHYECSGGAQKGRQALDDLAGSDPAKAERVLQALLDGLDLLRVDRDLGKLGKLLEDASGEAQALPHLAPLLRTALPRLLKFPEEAQRVGLLAPRRGEGVPYYRTRFYEAVLTLAGPSADRATVLDQLQRMTLSGYRWDRDMPESAAALFTRLARKDPSLAEPLARMTLRAMPATGGSKAEWESLHAAVTERGWQPGPEDLAALAARLYLPAESTNRWAEEDFYRALQTLGGLDVSDLRLPGRDGQPVTLARHVAERLLFQPDEPGTLHLSPHEARRPAVMDQVHRFCLQDPSARDLLVEEAPRNPRALQLLASAPLTAAEAARLKPHFETARGQRSPSGAVGDLLDELRRHEDDPALHLLRYSAYDPTNLPREVLLSLRQDLAPEGKDSLATARVAAARLQDRPAREWTSEELLDLREADAATLLDRLGPRLLEDPRALTPGATAVLAPWQEALWDRTLARLPGSDPTALVDLVETAGALVNRPALDARVQADPLLAAWAKAAGVEAEDRAWAFEVYRTLVRATPALAGDCAGLLERLGPRQRESQELLALAAERVKAGQTWDVALLHAKAQQQGLPLPEGPLVDAGAIADHGSTVSIGGITLEVRPETPTEHRRGILRPGSGTHAQRG